MLIIRVFYVRVTTANSRSKYVVLEVYGKIFRLRGGELFKKDKEKN